jgi:hypothetical protein
MTWGREGRSQPSVTLPIVYRDSQEVVATVGSVGVEEGEERKELDLED